MWVSDDPGMNYAGNIHISARIEKKAVAARKLNKCLKKQVS